jgi:tRNA-splicing ligase RtcB
MINRFFKDYSFYYLMDLKKISENEWEIPKEKGMNVSGKIFVSEEMLKNVDEDAIQQIKNVAELPGIVKHSFAMPDVHVGYGFPIGGVAAFDLEKGIISPGGVGYDINCGVRFLTTNISVEDFMKKRKEILHDLKRTIPSGVGRGGKRYSQGEIIEVLKKGAEWALEKGFATKEDLDRCEENGKIENANPEDLSQKAISRGLPQLGNLGAGNHFIDVFKIEEIFDEKIAKVFGLNKNNICIMIHCGSRGLGHQVATDYIKLMGEEYGFSKFSESELTNAPINSELGKKYLSAMNCAVNFAFCNRQMIMYEIRELLKRYFSNSKVDLVYDVCHNIAKIEDHVVNGKKMKLCVHRKGATRCFGPGRKEIPEVYRKVGQPVLIPGSMGTASYVLVGTKKAEELSFGSTAHGAGRAHSRTWAKKELTKQDVESELGSRDILLEGSGKATIEESPKSYKDIEEVIKICNDVGLGKSVAKLRPIAVMIG